MTATAFGTGARALAGAFATLDQMRRLAWVPRRRPVPGGPRPDIQFDLEPFVPAPAVVEGVPVRFPPVHTVFVTAQLGGAPTRRDQDTLADALVAVEEAYPWSPAGVLTHLAYGLPYFRRLPAGLFTLHVPRLLSNTTRFVLEEAGAAATDRAARIEGNDLLITLRSDDPAHLADVLGWLAGSDDLGGRPVSSPCFEAGLELTSARAMFAQIGLPRHVAASERLPYAGLVSPRSPAWTGAAEPDCDAPASHVVFRGAGGLRYTTALAGDYFDNGAIQHLAHEVLDLPRFYDAGNPGADCEFIARVRDLFLDRDNETVSPAVVHQRLDGPGLDDLDVPGGERRPKNQYSAFVPSAAAFERMRPHGLERYLTATRRQNFLAPPRRHRAFPLLELA